MGSNQVHTDRDAMDTLIKVDAYLQLSSYLDYKGVVDAVHKAVKRFIHIKDPVPDVTPDPEVVVGVNVGIIALAQELQHLVND